MLYVYILDLYCTDLEKYGWTRDSEGKLDIIWDTPENVSKAKEIVNQTFSGCKCKTGCDTRKCSCKKMVAIVVQDASALAAESNLHHFLHPQWSRSLFRSWR